MEPWACIERVAIPGGVKTLALVRRGDDYGISVDDNELMATDLHGSEDAFAELACDRLESLHDARILVGGLGMGFTLATLLQRVGPHAKITVSELVPEVVRWHEEFVGEGVGHPLRDPRVEVVIGDVYDLMADPPTRWNAILLDVDNGPAAFTRQANGSLYTNIGLKRARLALEPRGILGVWSSAPYRFFTRRLRKNGFDAEVIRHQEPDESGNGIETHVLWMARRR